MQDLPTNSPITKPGLFHHSSSDLVAILILFRLSGSITFDWCSMLRVPSFSSGYFRDIHLCRKIVPSLLPCPWCHRSSCDIRPGNDKLFLLFKEKAIRFVLYIRYVQEIINYRLRSNSEVKLARWYRNVMNLAICYK